MNKQQIKARFFGAHIGCIVDVLGMAEYINGGVTWDENGVFKFFDGHEYHPFDDKCKLVLRPLSSITDVEAVDLFTMATGIYIVGIERSDDKIVGVGMGKGSGNIISGGGNVAMWTKISPLPVGRFLETWNSQIGDAPECAEYLAIDYLRSINICVPFMGLDPIVEGWAVLEEKFSANQPKNDFQKWLINQGYTRAGHAWVMPNNGPLAGGAHLSEKLDEWKSNAPQEAPKEEKI